MRQLKITKAITQRETASFDKYLQEISREKMINPEEEADLAKRIREGDQRALDKLVRANLRFVVSVAKQYQHQGLSLQDLINEGNIGLIKAAKRFDETKGFKFISYAVWWIRQSILQALGERSKLIRIPLNQVGTLSKIRKATSDLEQRLEREPNADELAESTELSSSEIQNAISAQTKSVSMDAPFSDQDSFSLHDILVDDDSPAADSSVMKDSLQNEILRALSTLPKREGEIVKLFFGIGENYGHSLEEIATQFHLTRERVRQIKEKALRRLKLNPKTNILRGYLGQ